MNKKNEKWMPVKGYESLYEVSNMGRVKRLDTVLLVNGRWVSFRGGIMQLMDNGHGYMRVKLSKNNKNRRHMVHRVVAEAFIPNPFKKTDVNHKNGIKADNRMENLEWATRVENVRHAINTGLIDISRLKKRASANGSRTISNIAGWNSKKVLDNNNGKIYNSIREAAIENGLNVRTLNDRLNGRRINNTSLSLID